MLVIWEVWPNPKTYGGTQNDPIGGTKVVSGLHEAFELSNTLQKRHGKALRGVWMRTQIFPEQAWAEIRRK